MVETKFQQTHRLLQLLTCSDADIDAAAATPFTTPTLSTYKGMWNRWIALSFVPGFATSDACLYPQVNNLGSAATMGFNDSPFALKVPQGTGFKQRIGRDIYVKSDDWFMRVSIPPLVLNTYDQDVLNPDGYDRVVNPKMTLTTGGISGKLNYNFENGYAIKNFNLHPRVMRARFICIMQSVVDRPGEFGFTPNELFESQHDIHSRFSKDDATGYRILYDRTHRFCPPNANEGVSGTINSSFVVQRNDMPDNVVVRLRTKYLRRYEGVSGADNTAGTEIDLDGSGQVLGGVSRGALTWYMFLEDAYTNQSASNATSATSSGYAKWATPSVIDIEINRKTMWTDS